MTQVTHEIRLYIQLLKPFTFCLSQRGVNLFQAFFMTGKALMNHFKPIYYTKKNFNKPTIPSFENQHENVKKQIDLNS